MNENFDKKEIIISLVCQDSSLENLWKSELKTLFRTLLGPSAIRAVSIREMVSDLIFIDFRKKDWQDLVRNLDREEKSLVLVLEEGGELPGPDDLGLVDDLLAAPFRPAALLSILRHHFSRKDTRRLRAGSEEALCDLESANSILQAIVQAKTPKRFDGLKGIQVRTRHLSGLKPGGDYFDVFESDRKEFVNFLLVDSSSYGISAALLGVILSSSAKIAASNQSAPAHWIRAIFEEIKLTLGDAGHFSVFFGRMNRKDFSLHYQMYGSVEAFVVDRNGESRKLSKQGSAISNASRPESEEEAVIALQPKDRLVLLSDGFISGAGGEHRLTRLFSDQSGSDPFFLVNELAFHIKSKLNPGETFPGEDCTAIVIDIEGRVLRLAPTG